MLVYLNGNFIDHTEATVSVADRGFVFGDGVYEVTRVINGRFFREKEHLSRLDEGLSGLKINLDPSEKEKISAVSRELLEKNNHNKGEAAVYLQVTRGAAWPRTHTFPEPPVKPTVYISTSPFKPHTELHISGVAAITLQDVRWTRCNLKTVNLLPNTLAKQMATDAGVNSALLIRDGVVTESPNANIFGVKGNALFTFPASNYILSGITRLTVIEIAEKLHIPVHYLPVRAEELYDLDEIFFSGTTTDIQPVTIVDGRQIGNGKPGPIVKAIQEEYGKLL
ncbi:MAG: D-amino-acid transaminase, partial [Balneolaceae bacterium]